MPDADQLLRTLRQDDTHLRALVALGVEDLLQRRVEELVQPEWLAQRVAEGLKASADDERTREWIRERIADLRGRLEHEDGAPLQRLNPELIEPIKELLARPYSPDAKVLLALLDHAAMRELVRDVLVHTLQAYARQLRVPDGAKQAIRSSGLGRSRLAAWAGAAKVAANMVGSEVERRVEGRVHEFVDEAIGSAIEVGVRHICDPKHAVGFGRMRADEATLKMAEVNAHLGETYFAWMGRVDDDSPFYYRVHSPVILIEFDHQRGVALDNAEASRAHIHTIVRTPNGNDYGADLLRQHHERHAHS